MPDTQLLTRIQSHLDRRELNRLFCDVLNWDSNDERAFDLQVGVPVSGSIRLEPVAHLKRLPAYHAKWPGDRLPNVTERRAVHKALSARNVEHFLCYETQNQKSLGFVWARERADKRVELRTLPYEIGQLARTTIERLAELRFDLRELTALNVVQVTDRLEKAFDVEAVSDKFFEKYAEVFAKVEKAMESSIRDKDRRRLFTQRLFNRLMFIAFVQKKGWLSFNGSTDYLKSLWQGYQLDRRAGDSFYKGRLRMLFFEALNDPRDLNIGGINQTYSKGGIHKLLIGDVPYLNGGLFDKHADDEDEGISVPDECFPAIFEDIFDHFNFTVTESTPLDIEVAVDPEMLGRVFEELVTGRHETGSYYTPRPIVSFMCREALKAYLATTVPGETAEAIERFVEQRDSSGLARPEAVLNALRKVKIVDPACGSGAYLLGMLHELLELRQCLFAVRSKNAQSAYDLKLEIVENNLYGVDSDEFAVNIARLRLWLSLSVDFEGKEGELPPPLPNLKFKIERGDSLTAPDPGHVTDLFRELALKHSDNLAELKGMYMKAHTGGEKRQLEQEIAAEEGLLRSALRHDPAPEGALDWRVAFAEVFRDGGFDIVSTNPPYLRMELFKDAKPRLKANFAYVHDERSDLYVYFYARAHELLKPGGHGCLISSDKWLRSAYGEPLRKHLLDAQTFKLVVDFGELPVFKAAATFPGIFLWQKRKRDEASTWWATVRDLDVCYSEGIREHVTRIGIEVPASQFGAGKSRLARPEAADMRTRMESSGSRLGLFVKGRIWWGIKTGLNDAFYIDDATRDGLISEDKRSSEVIKPLVVGDDVRHYELHYRGRYMLYMPHGVEISRYPAVRKHLLPFKARLLARATQQEWYKLQQPQAAYVRFVGDAKIVYPVMGKVVRFTLDAGGYYGNDKTYFIPSGDWYLLAVLNSAAVFEYLKGICSVLGDESRGGRLEFRAVYMETLPIPDAPKAEREAVAKLAQRAQELHGQRRKRVEKFLHDIGTSPAESSSKNKLEEPWNADKCTDDYFRKKAKGYPLKLLSDIRAETIAMTDEILKVEAEIDARVRALYGL